MEGLRVRPGDYIPVEGGYFEEVDKLDPGNTPVTSGIRVSGEEY